MIGRFVDAESPPTMDDISKEIYRFRKKFNIQPNPESAGSSTSPTSSVPAAAVSPIAKGPSSSSLLPPFPRVTPKITTSTPVKRSNNDGNNADHTYETLRDTRSNNNCPLINTSISPVYSVRNTRPFSSMRRLVSNNSSSSSSTSKPNDIVPNQQQQRQAPSRIGSLRLSGAKTSLGDFKRLLQATQRKRNSISAMEILKPKRGLETTI